MMSDDTGSRALDEAADPDPVIIQRGMGVAVSGWRLARAVSMRGQLGVVSGTALDVVLARRLQLGDATGDLRRAIRHFSDAAVAERVLESHFVPGGKRHGQPFASLPMFTAAPSVRRQELAPWGCPSGWLARARRPNGCGRPAATAPPASRWEPPLRSATSRVSTPRCARGFSARPQTAGSGSSRIRWRHRRAFPSRWPSSRGRSPSRTSTKRGIGAATSATCELYRRADGRLGYRCPAEPAEDYVRKGGRVEDTAGRKCVCNGLVATVGLGQWRGTRPEPALVTAGDDARGLGRFMRGGRSSFSASDVIACLLDAP